MAFCQAGPFPGQRGRCVGIAAIVSRAGGERKPILQNHAMDQQSEPMPESRQLALINQATKALTEAKTLDQIRAVRDRAEAVRHYARSASLSLDLQNQAAEIKLRAERKAGKLLADLALRGGNRKSKSQTESLMLADLGINRNQSSRWQQMAAVPETQFQRCLDETKAAHEELSAAGLRRLARRLRPAKSRENLVVRVPRRFAQDEPGSSAEIIHEAKNHLAVATGLLAPLCTTDIWNWAALSANIFEECYRKSASCSTNYSNSGQLG